MTIAETYSLSQLRRRVYRFMSAHLCEFSQTPDFHRLALQQFEHLLGCDFPVDCPEVDVLRIVLRWLQGVDNLRLVKISIIQILKLTVVTVEILFYIICFIHSFQSYSKSQLCSATIEKSSFF